MQRHKVGLLQHLFHIQHGYTKLASKFRGYIGIKGDDLHFEPLGAASYFCTDLAKANDAKYFIAYFDTQEAIFLPFPRFEPIVATGNFPTHPLPHADVISPCSSQLTI